MILQALIKYYHRLAEVECVPPQGFKRVGIPFLIILNKHGEFIGLEDTRTLSGRKFVARSFIVPEEQERSGSKAWQTSNLLWDHYGYILGWPKSDSDDDKAMAQKQHKTFVAKVQNLFDIFPSDEGIRAIYHFLSTEDFSAVFSHPLWQDCARIPGCNLSFRFELQPSLICENENVRSYVEETNCSAPTNEEDDSDLRDFTGICLITGEEAEVARTHPRTPIPGAKSNAKIVSFQKNMGFDSYGKQQSYNAPVSKRAAFAYTTVVNHMLKGSRQHIQVGDATTLFWAEKRHDMEDVFSSFFGEPAGEEPEQDYKSLIAMFRSPESGARVELEPSTKFYVLGLAPNAARIAVRFWYVGTVGEVANNIWQHFDDIEMVKSQTEWRNIKLRSLLRSIALKQEDKNIPPNLAGDTMKSILTGTPYPQTLLNAAIRRCRAEREITYPRASIIKALLVRESRFYNRKEKEVGMSLDPENKNTGYLLGRLFAVLERAQESASPGINATIRDRFYGSASSTPVAVFPHLMKLKNHHIAKLENRGAAVNLEKQIGGIMEGVSDFPAHLSLQDQGRFAVGYYHQRQSFFARKDNQ